jgi:hypothetical protein
LSKFFGWILELFCHHHSKLNIFPCQERTRHDLLMDRIPLFLASNKGLGPCNMTYINISWMPSFTWQILWYTIVYHLWRLPHLLA